MIPKKISDALTMMNSVLNFFPEKQREAILKAGFFDFLTKDDETAFMAALAKLDEEFDGGKDIILAWLQRDKEGENKGKVAYLFRKLVTTHPDVEVRIKILASYAKEGPTEEDDKKRYKRLEAETIPVWFVTAFWKWLKNLKQYISDEVWNDIKNTFFVLIEPIKDAARDVYKKVDEACAPDTAVSDFTNGLLTKSKTFLNKQKSR